MAEQLWGEISVSIAQAGSNFLEYGRLSELTRDEQYLNNVFQLTSRLILGNGSMVASREAKAGIFDTWDGSRACVH